MRADRLVSILMLLQSRGKVPAGTLAEILGVSVRTVYRDMDALSMAGIPVYAERGVEGGCCLVEDYRTDLTGLNEDEARALFLLTAPGPLDALAVGQKLRSALRKLAAALPARLPVSGQVRPRLWLDWSGLDRLASSGEHLENLYHAVECQERVQLAYRLWAGIEIEQVACPLGLVARAGEWHLAWQTAAGKLRWRRVSDLIRVELTGESFTYPTDFDLRAAWEEACAEQEAREGLYTVLVRASPEAVTALRQRQGVKVMKIGPKGKGGWAEVDLGFSFFESARSHLIGFGDQLEVLEPLPLRLSVADFARRALSLYEGGDQRPEEGSTA